jgi:hypothetical protein
LDSCFYTLWEDSEPYGSILDALLACSDNDDNNDDDNPLASQLSCNGDQLMFTFYDSCESKNCQFLGIPVSNSTYEETHSLQDNTLCLFSGTVDSCNSDDLVFKIRPCGQIDDDASGSPSSIGSMRFNAKKRLQQLNQQVKSQIESVLLRNRNRAAMH